MRKIALLTVPLLVLGLFSVSADVMMGDGITAEVSGNSTLTFGINLNNNASGFTNAMEADLKVTIIPEQTSDTGMMDMDDLYAYIELKDFKWEVAKADDDGHAAAATVPSITTKVFMGPFSITTFSAPTVEVDYVDPDDDDDDDVADVGVTHEGSGGLTLGYDLAPITLSLGLVSMADWTDDTEKDAATHTHDDDGAVVDVEEADAADQTEDANVNNGYAILGTVGVDLGDSAELEVAVAYAHEYADEGSDIGLGAKATFDLGNIDPHIAFDGAIPPDNSSIPWDVEGGITWNLSADEKSSFETSLLMYVPAEGDSTVGVSATLTEGDADEGALEGLGAAVTLALNDLTGASSTWSTEVDAHYLVEGIKPFFMVKFSNADEATTAFKAGLELSMIDHLTTTPMLSLIHISEPTRPY